MCLWVSFRMRNLHWMRLFWVNWLRRKAFTLREFSKTPENIFAFKHLDDEKSNIIWWQSHFALALRALCWVFSCDCSCAYFREIFMTLSRNVNFPTECLQGKYCSGIRQKVENYLKLAGIFPLKFALVDEFLCAELKHNSIYYPKIKQTRKKSPADWKL